MWVKETSVEKRRQERDTLKNKVNLTLVFNSSLIYIFIKIYNYVLYIIKQLYFKYIFISTFI